MNKITALAEVRPTSAIDLPDTTVVARDAFGIDTDMVVPAFSVRTEHVPDIDDAYRFDPQTTIKATETIDVAPPRPGGALRERLPLPPGATAP